MIEAATNVIVARSDERETWAPVIVTSVIAHLVLVAGIVLTPGHDLSKDVPKTVMTISLGGSPGPRAGGMTPIGGRAVQEVAPPGPKPRADTPPAPKAPEMTLPSKAVRLKPDLHPQVTSKEAAGRTTTKGAEIQDGSSRVDTGARGQGFGLTGGGGSGAGAYLDAKDFCCPEYLETVVQTIQRNWESKQNLVGRTLMKVTIDRTGVLRGIQVEVPSGFAPLDLAAERALYATQRVPPLPAEFPNSTLTVHFTFEYQR
jgi:TonB family protein